MFVSSITLKDISIEMAGSSHMEFILRDFRSGTIAKSFTQEFISVSNISSASWLIALAKESHKRLLQQRYIVVIFWNSSISLPSKVRLLISRIVAFAGAVSSKLQSMLSPVGICSARLVSKLTDAPRPEPLSKSMNVHSSHMGGVNLDRYTSSQRQQEFECLCWMSICCFLSYQ